MVLNPKTFWRWDLPILPCGIPGKEIADIGMKICTTDLRIAQSAAREPTKCKPRGCVCNTQTEHRCILSFLVVLDFAREQRLSHSLYPLHYHFYAGRQTVTSNSSLWPTFYTKKCNFEVLKSLDLINNNE